MIRHRFLHRLTSMLLIITSVCMLISIPCHADSHSLPRDISGRFLISDATGLYDFALAVNNGERDARAVLVCDIDLNPGVSYCSGGTDIGSPREWTPIYGFSGDFDGNGHTVSGLYFNNTGTGQTGLFGSSSGTIRNLNVERYFIHSGSDAGGICGINSGTISACSAGDGYIVISAKNAGGICGSNEGIITDCHNNGTSVRGGMAAYNIGGICGFSTGEIMRCVNSANISAPNYDEACVGGICGQCSGIIRGCLNAGEVSGCSGGNGGICGKLAGGSIVGCLSTGSNTRTGTYSRIGYICGENANGSVTGCCYVEGELAAPIGVNNGNSSGLYGYSKSGLSDGRAACILNEADSEAGWSQLIGTDEFPSPGGIDTVYLRTYYSGCSTSCSAHELLTNTEADVFAADHTDADNNGLCDSCGITLNKIVMVSVLLGTDITVRYYARLNGAAADAKITFNMNGSSSTVTGTKMGEYYVYDYCGVAPQCIGDNISAALILNGSVLDTRPEYTVADYCHTLLAGSASDFGYSEDKFNAMKNVVKDLLIYGGAAQRYVGYKTDSLVSEGIEASGTMSDGVPSKILTGNGVHVTFTGAALAYDSKTYIIIYFRTDDADGLELRLTTGSGVNITLPIMPESNGYSVITPAISACDFDKMLTLTAYREGIPGASVSYSVGCYTGAMRSEKIAALAAAAYAYGVSSAGFVEAK